MAEEEEPCSFQFTSCSCHCLPSLASSPWQQQSLPGGNFPVLGAPASLHLLRDTSTSCWHHLLGGPVGSTRAPSASSETSTAAKQHPLVLQSSGPLLYNLHILITPTPSFVLLVLQVVAASCNSYLLLPFLLYQFFNTQ